MHQLAVERGGIVQRLLHAVAEGVLPAWQAGKAALAGGAVAGRAVDQHLRQTVVLQPRTQLCRGEFVGCGVLDPGEPGLCRRLEPVKKRQLGKQKADIGADAGHESPPDAGHV